ncbi:hypothetical protein SXCC_00097 [Gluconacetobacter sp. SXCC-1]|nr:hypothetical protein SXCC_00097 [Gluconacetobacter sp. SXCC-1]
MRGQSAFLEYPSWSRTYRKPIPIFAQQGVSQNDDTPHDRSDGDFLGLSGFQHLLVFAMKIMVRARTHNQ